ncbi:MAG: NeuD/PglB/VioB family sugar acetyltransferase [Campylobacterota bacterium]|nr:NeuD/PglB/VioB family sugar acetyltransferase [Campylobacterota bacterium]
MENILLIGGGGHCKAVIDVIEQENRYHITGIVDKKESIGKKILGYEVIGCDNDLKDLYTKYTNAAITIGHIKTNDARVSLYKQLKRIGFTFPIIVSPLAYISKHSTIDEGTVVMHHALINAGVRVGKNCIINTKALIEHDCIIEDNCHISTASVLNGGVTVKQNSFFGSNAVSKESIVIDNFIKAGSIVK